MQLVSLCEMTIDLGEMAVESFVNSSAFSTARLTHRDKNNKRIQPKTFGVNKSRQMSISLTELVAFVLIFRIHSIAKDDAPPGRKVRKPSYVQK